MVFLILKSYIYNQDAPYVGIDINGKQFKIHKGDEVHFNGELFATEDGHLFALSEERRKWFTRLFSQKEEEYYTELHHQAAIAALQGLLSDHVLLQACLKAGKQLKTDIQTAAARNAVSYADALIKELKYDHE